MTVSEQDFTGAGGGLQIIVSGQDPSEIKVASDVIMSELRLIDGLDNVASDATAEAPQVSVSVDPNQAALIGSSTAQLGRRHPERPGGSVHRLIRARGRAGRGDHPPRR